MDRRQSLDAVPLLAEGVQTEAHGAEGGLALQVSFSQGSTWMNRFRPRVDSRRYELDAFGSFVVQQFDGQRSVREIMDRFQEHFGMSRRESELGVVAFIKMLLQRRLVMIWAETASDVKKDGYDQ